ncbi:hypothetical protein Esti_004788 [Eimeria stiedai]
MRKSPCWWSVSEQDGLGVLEAKRTYIGKRGIRDPSGAAAGLGPKGVSERWMRCRGGQEAKVGARINDCLATDGVCCGGNAGRGRVKGVDGRRRMRACKQKGVTTFAEAACVLVVIGERGGGWASALAGNDGAALMSFDECFRGASQREIRGSWPAELPLGHLKPSLETSPALPGKVQHASAQG